MDDTLKLVATKMAEHIVRLAEQNKGKAIAISEKTADFLLSEVCRILYDPPKGKSK